MDRVSSILCKQPNQMKDSDWEIFDSVKGFVLSVITHVIDIDGWILDSSRKLYGEVSVYDIKKMSVQTFQIYHPGVFINNTDWRKVIYSTRNIHGLKFNFTSQSCLDVTYEQFIKLLDRDGIYAYKGGCLERELCSRLSIYCVNLELFNCKKYEKLIEEYALTNKHCNRHCLYKGKIDKLHCNTYEVFVFAMFVFKSLASFSRYEYVKKQYLNK